MQNINTFDQAKNALYEYIPKGHNATKYNLENMTKLMDYIDNPQEKLKIIHVAGTSGKTSTSYFAASLLKAAGYSVGLTVSPHIDEINERVQIDLVPLPEQEYCAEISIFLNIIKTSSLNPSYFEILIAFSYWIFAKNNMEYAVVEVGLGGTMDGTNIINRNDKICIITDIGLDHTKILGSTIEEIAIQKAGIIKNKNTVFMYHQDKNIMNIVKNRCHEKNADLFEIQPNYETYVDSSQLPLFQKRNLHLSIQAVNYTLNRDYNQKLTDKQIEIASKVYVPGRMEKIIYHDKTIILDGSHNEQKISALTESILQKYPTKSITLMVSFGENKQTSVESCLKLLAKISDKIIITSFDLGQDEVRVAINPDDLAILAKKAGFIDVITESNPLQALKILENDNADIGLVTGSFYLLGNLRPVVLR